MGFGFGISTLFLLISCSEFQCAKNPSHIEFQAEIQLEQANELKNAPQLIDHLIAQSSTRLLLEQCPEGFLKDMQGNCARCPVKACSACPKQYCEKCMKGYALVDYWNCIPCEDTNCETCFDEDAALCKKCLANFTLLRNKCIKCHIPNCELCLWEDSCVRCSNGTFLEPGSRRCEACKVPNCALCSKNEECELCNEGFEITDKNTCELIRNKSFKCTNYTSLNCYSCEPSFRLDTNNHSCEPCLIAKCKDCASDKSTCQECEAGFTLNKTSGSCLECPSGCKTCLDTNTSICQSCLKGFSLRTSTCTECRIRNCEDCFADPGSCDRCKNEYYLVVPSYQCKPCPYNCDMCDGETCLQCNNRTRMKLTSSECVECDTNCESGFCNDIGKCLMCKPGYYMKRDPYRDQEEYCVSCGFGCQICSEEGECLIPKANFYLHNNSIVRICPKGLKPYFNRCKLCNILNCNFCAEPNICMECNKAYRVNSEGGCDCVPESTYFNETDSTCHLCTEKFKNCQTCNQTACIKCFQGFQLLAFDKNTSSSNETCVKSLSRCPENCFECNIPTNCTICDYGFTLSKESPFCLLNCSSFMPNCLECNSKYKCDSCDCGYFLGEDNSVCKKCYPTCSTCSGPKDTDCTSCLDVLTTRTRENKCQGNCKNLIPNCKSCGGPLNLVCEKCYDGYAVSTEKNRCLKCPADCEICISRGEATFFCLEAKTHFINSLNGTIEKDKFEISEFLDQLNTTTDDSLSPEFELRAIIDVTLEFRRKNPGIRINNNFREYYEEALLSNLIYVLNKLIAKRKFYKSEVLGNCFQTLFFNQRLIKSLTVPELEINNAIVFETLHVYINLLKNDFQKGEYDQLITNVFALATNLKDDNLRIKAYEIFKYFLGIIKVEPQSQSYQFESRLANFSVSLIDMNSLKQGFNIPFNYLKEIGYLPKSLIFRLSETNGIYSNFLRIAVSSFEGETRALFPYDLGRFKIISNTLEIAFFDDNGEEYLLKNFNPAIKIKLLKPDQEYQSSNNESSIFCAFYTNRAWADAGARISNVIKINDNFIECMVDRLGVLAVGVSLENSADGSSSILISEFEIKVGNAFWLIWSSFNVIIMLIAYLFFKNESQKFRFEFVSIEETWRNPLSNGIATILPIISIFRSRKAVDKQKRVLLLLNLLYFSQLLAGTLSLDSEQGLFWEIFKLQFLLSLGSYMQGILSSTESDDKKLRILLLTLINFLEIYLSLRLSNELRNFEELKIWVEKWILLISLDFLLDGLFILFFYILKSTFIIKCIIVFKLKGFYQASADQYMTN